MDTQTSLQARNAVKNALLNADPDSPEYATLVNDLLTMNEAAGLPPVRPGMRVSAKEGKATQHAVIARVTDAEVVMRYIDTPFMTTGSTWHIRRSTFDRQVETGSLTLTTPSPRKQLDDVRRLDGVDAAASKLNRAAFDGDARFYRQEIGLGESRVTILIFRFDDGEYLVLEAPRRHASVQQAYRHHYRDCGVHA